MGNGVTLLVIGSLFLGAGFSILSEVQNKYIAIGYVISGVVLQVSGLIINKNEERKETMNNG